VKDGSSITKIKKSESNWVHFIGGGLGGSFAAIATCPLEVVKTRLQSLMKANVVVTSRPFGTRMIYTFWEIYTVEGIRALWRGLGPNLVGVAPARALHFTTYNGSKRFLTRKFGLEEDAKVHLLSAAFAGASVHTVTSPVWLVKTRMQLQTNRPTSNQIQYKNSLDCVMRVWREEGVKGFYRGLVASYVGISETAIQFVLYEKFKERVQTHNLRLSVGEHVPMLRSDIREVQLSSMETLTIASVAKLIAAALTYPHEVIRTRMREQRETTGMKYTGFLQALKLIAAEEGARGLYGGMGAHLIRTVPNSAIMFWTYETVVRILSSVTEKQNT